MTDRYPKDPEAKLDYQFKWSDWLDPTTDPTERIASYTITVPTGMTLESSAITDGVNKDGVEMPASRVTVWLSAGLGGEVCRVECLINTTHGRVDERSIWITVGER